MPRQQPKKPASGSTIAVRCPAVGLADQFGAITARGGPQVNLALVGFGVLSPDLGLLHANQEAVQPERLEQLLPGRQRAGLSISLANASGLVSAIQ